LQDINATTVLAQNDIAFSQARIDAAAQLQVTLTSTKTTINAWSPAATYSRNDLIAVRGQLSGIIDQLAALTTAVSELYTYRKANDQNVVLTNKALVWIAQQSLGDNGGEGDGLT
jgi:hypothetical protein